MVGHLPLPKMSPPPVFLQNDFKCVNIKPEPITGSEIGSARYLGLSGKDRIGKRYTNTSDMLTDIGLVKRNIIKYAFQAEMCS